MTLFFILIFVTSTTLGAFAQQSEEILDVDDRSKRSLPLGPNAQDPCSFYTNSVAVAEYRRQRDFGLIRGVSDDDLNAAIALCQRRNPQSQNTRQTTLIHPGTKWCGPGNIAQHFNDLGVYAETDRCCRAHDNCFEFMRSGECKHGLCNTSPFTRAHCDCDNAFRQCLMNVGDTVSNSVGVAFFNVAGVVCYRNELASPACSGITSVKRRKRCAAQEGQSRSTGLWRFTQQAPYKLPVGRSIAEPDAPGGVVGRMRNLVSTVGDVGTVLRTVAHSALDVYRQQRQAAAFALSSRM